MYPNQQKRILIIICVVVISIALIVGLVFLFLPKNKTGTIVDMSWERRIEIEEYCTVQESDWYIPAGGREIHREWMISGYYEEIDHWETYYETVEVFDHWEEVVSWRLNDDGEYEEIIDYEAVYTTSLEEYEEPVYVDIPIYDWYYTYEIERWLHQSYKTTSGLNKSPYWSDYQPTEYEREGRRLETYKIIIIDENGKEHEYKLQESQWQTLDIGQDVQLKTYITGNAELILD